MKCSQPIPSSRMGHQQEQRARRAPTAASALLPIQSLLLLALLFLITPAAAYTKLSDNFLRRIPSPGSDFDIHNGPLLAPILVTRVPGTDGQVTAQRHFVDFFRTNLPKWTVEWHNSTSKTPATGDRELPFANLIIRRDPPWTKPGQTNYLTLAAHYDSKIQPTGFIGATDSAAPCAMLMHVARSLDKYIEQMHTEMAALGEGGTVPMDMGVQILLLDGEEAFVSWTATDSLYGARALARSWENQVNPARTSYGYHDPLDQISLFLLLDLLGSADPEVPSYFQNTHWAYQGMADIEDRMRKLGLLETKPRQPFLIDAKKASNTFGRSYVEDDHVPFMYRGVDILHIIPSPFPRVWHTLEDDGPHLDMPTVRDWAKIVTAFTMEWLDMMEVEPQ